MIRILALIVIALLYAAGGVADAQIGGTILSLGSRVVVTAPTGATLTFGGNIMTIRGGWAGK